MTGQDVLDFFLRLEGPYKWYVLGGVLVLMTAVMTRVIFKTFKWFLILVALAVVILTALHYLTPLRVGEWLWPLG